MQVLRWRYKDCQPAHPVYELAHWWALDGTGCYVIVEQLRKKTKARAEMWLRHNWMQNTFYTSSTRRWWDTGRICKILAASEIMEIPTIFRVRWQPVRGEPETEDWMAEHWDAALGSVYDHQMRRHGAEGYLEL